MGAFEGGFWVLLSRWCLIGRSLVVGMMVSEERNRGKNAMPLLLQLAWCYCSNRRVDGQGRERESLVHERTSG